MHGERRWPWVEFDGNGVMVVKPVRPALMCVEDNMGRALCSRIQVPLILSYALLAPAGRPCSACACPLAINTDASNVSRYLETIIAAPCYMGFLGPEKCMDCIRCHWHMVMDIQPTLQPLKEGQAAMLTENSAKPQRKHAKPLQGAYIGRFIFASCFPGFFSERSCVHTAQGSNASMQNLDEGATLPSREP